MDHIEEQMRHQAELRARRKAWEEQREAEAEQQSRQEKQTRMEAWLNSRRQAWVDHVGSLPPTSTVEGWKHEYIAERASEEELERELRLAQAVDDAVL